MQNYRDYYAILGIDQAATGDEIKRAYRALARQYHPDLNPGDKAAEEKFKLLGEAYDVLSDVDKRSQYEEYSRYWKQKGSGRTGRWAQWANVGSAGRSAADAEYSAFEDFDNFVEQLLKRHKDDGNASMWETPTAQAAATPRPQAPARSADRAESRSSERSTDRSAGRSESKTSGKVSREASGQTSRRAGSRTGSRTGNRSDYRPQQAKRSRRDAEADLTVPLEKAYAGGRERIRFEDGRSLEVNMPPGMVTGQRIRLKGQGIDGGNLYLRIEVEPHPYFTLKEGDVYCRLPITPSEAALGTTIAVPTLGGPVTMMVPPGVQYGQRLKLTGKGYPISPELYGDQIVEIEVVVPTVLDDEEKALYQELSVIERFDPRANLL